MNDVERRFFDYLARGVPYGLDDGTPRLFLVSRAADFTLMLVVIGAVAASAGILSPILTCWISAKAGSAQGRELGKQTTAASLGITLGSAARRLRFNAAALSGSRFVLTSGLAVLGFLLSLRLPHLLVHPHGRMTGGQRKLPA